MRDARARVAVGALVIALAGGAATAQATPKMLTESKKMGMPAKNCEYCHTEKLPKKETFKPEALNERGKFLQADMKQRSLKDPDLKKLESFPGGKEQK
jgi:hypothetical protein